MPVEDKGEAVDSIILVSTTGHILVFNGLKLIWSADTSPTTSGLNVYIQVCQISSLRGLILTMDEFGSICISYLGTDPPTDKVARDSKKLDYEEMEREHRKLLRTIRDSREEIVEGSSGTLELRAQVPGLLECVQSHEVEDDFLESHGDATVKDLNGNILQLKVRLYLNLIGKCFG